MSKPASKKESTFSIGMEAMWTDILSKSDGSEIAPAPVNTEPLQISSRYCPGVSGNPNGRPKGSRNKFTNTFMRILAEDFTANGREALNTLRNTNPEAYIRAIISLLPKSHILEYEQSFDVDFENISNEDLVEVLNEIQRRRFVEKALEATDSF